jgi:hypothetical protein
MAAAHASARIVRRIMFPPWTMSKIGRLPLEHRQALPSEFNEYWEVSAFTAELVILPKNYKGGFTFA